MKNILKKFGIYFGIFAVTIVLFLLPLVNNLKMGFAIAILLQLFLYIYLAQAWNLIGGLAGLFSLGHSVYFGIGAYSLIITTNRFHMNPWLGVIIGISISIIISILVGISSSRLSGLFFAMFTLGLIKIFSDLSTQWTTLTGGSQGITTPKYLTIGTSQAYYIFLIMCILSVSFIWILRRSKLGTCCVAIRENESFARSLGVKTELWKILIVMISSIMVCLSGFIFAMYIRGIYPTMVFSFNMSTKMIIVTLIGGSGMVFGPLVGGIIIIIDELIRASLGSAYGGVSYIIYGLMLVLLILFLPNGLIEKMERKNKYLQ